MALADIVNVVIAANTVTPTRAGYGVPLICSYHTKYTDRVRTYTQPNDLVADGFATTDPEFLCATSLKVQNPSVTSFKVGRRALPPTDGLTLKILDATPGDTIAFTLEGHAFSYPIATPSLTASAGDTLTFSSVSHTITRSTGSWIADGFAVGQSPAITGTSSNNGSPGAITVLTDTVMTFAAGIVTEGPLSATATVTATQTVAGVADALQKLIVAAALATLGTVTVATDTITVPALTPGHVLRLQGWDLNKVDVEITTADPGLATDLAAIALADNNWYGLLLTDQSPAQIQAAAAYGNTNKKLFCYDTPNGGCAGSGSADIASTLKGLAYEHTHGLFNSNDTQGYSGAAMMGNRFPFDPGSDTWMFKTLKGVSPDSLTPTQLTNLKGKNLNYYTTIAGINMVSNGVSADGEFTDVIRGLDWLTTEIQANVFGALAANPKVPYTDAGIDVIRGQVLAALQAAEKVGLLVKGSSVVTAPLAAAQSSADRASRNLPNVNFSANLAGAIHKVTVNGTVTV